jgi:hypothetical protein
MATAGALVVLVALFLIEVRLWALGSKQEATANEKPWMTPTLASDANLPDSEPAPAPSRVDPPPPPERKPTLEGEPAAALEVTIEPARKRKPTPSKPKPNPVDEFMQDNPYE